jgi:hypothetical protein
VGVGGGNGCLGRDRNWITGKGGTRRERGNWRWGKRYEGCWVLWPLCVFRCISVVAVEVACVRDFRGLGVCVWLVQ